MLRRHRRNLVIAFGSTLVGMGATVLGPLVLRQLIDDIAVGRSLEASGLAALVALGVVRFVAAVVRRWYAGRVSFDIEYDLRDALYGHLQRLDFAAHDRLETGQLVSRAGSDVRMIQGLLAFLPLMSGNLVLLVMSLAVMTALSPPLTAIAILIVPVLTGLSVRMRNRVFPATWDSQQRAAAVAGVVEEAVTGVRVVKAFAAEGRERDRLEDRARALYASRVRNVRIQAQLVPFISSVPMLGLAGLLYVGGRMVLDGSISLGTFLAFNSYLVQLGAPACMLSMVTAAGQMARAGGVRILELLDSAPDVADRPRAEPMGDIDGAVEFSGVTFGYGDTVLFENLDLRIEAGERVAFVGPSGSGKSTLALLPPRFYDVDAGRVTVDGRDVRDVGLTGLRRNFGVVFEDAFLFSATIRDNIAYGVPDATDEQVRAAARAAEADGFVEALPAGYATVVGERGLTLSGGQRQRITLARALLTDPRVLILDDATSAIDATVEAEIHTTLRRLMAGRTTIIVAHRKSTIALADRIVVLDGGRIVADGTHDELVGTSAVYRALVGETAADNGVAPAGAVPNGHAPTRSDASPRAAASDLPLPRPGAWGGGGGGGMRGGVGGGGGGWMGGLEDEDLERLVAALPPATDEPRIDPDEAARPDPAFSLGRFVRPWRWALAVGVLLVAVDAVSGLLGPALVRHGVQGGVAEGDRAALARAALAYAAIAVVGWWALWAQSRWTGRLSERMLYSLRLKVFGHITRLGLDFYEREMAGRVMTRMTSDIEALTQLFQQGISNLFVSAFTAFGVGIALFLLDWRLAMAGLSVTPLLLAATWWFRHRSDRAYEWVRDTLSGVMANLQESVSGVRVTQAFGREIRNVEVFRLVAGEHLDARLEANRLSATYFPAVEFLSQVAVALVVGFGASRVRSGTLTAADLIAFVLYLNLFFAPIQQLSQVFDVYQQAQAAVNKLSLLLATPVHPPLVAGAPAPAARLSTLRLNGVHFAYPGESALALEDVDLEIAAGETVALVGRTGAGKSTVVKLLARFYDPTAGSVTAVDAAGGEHDIRSFDGPGYRGRLGLVPQDAHLFSGTIADNIAYGRPDAARADIEAAARAVGADTFVEALPAGYDARVSERGRSLSSGQRQLLALARARLVDPDVLLLDEATSNLDLASEARVQAAMGALSQGRTTVLVAHRLATAARADRIIVMAGGRVAEQGSHTELLEAGGLYAAMWSAGDPETGDPEAGEPAAPTHV